MDAGIHTIQCHLLEGAAGCAFARERQAVAVIVDALRASATATSLLAAGAVSLLMVRTVSEARAAHQKRPETLLFGERNGLPPEGFDGGNSPRAVAQAIGRPVVFTTTTGAQRMVDAWGARAVCMGTTLNATAVAAFALERAERDIVLIPAGLAEDPAFDAQEDWVAATVIAQALMRLNPLLDIQAGRERYETYATRIAAEGVLSLFESAPHAEKLRRVHLEGDIPFCAAQDRYDVVPQGRYRVTEPEYEGILVGTVSG